MLSAEELQDAFPKYVTWEEVELFSTYIANQCRNFNIGAIVAVGRGGYIPSVIVSHQLEVPIIPINWGKDTDGKRSDLDEVVHWFEDNSNILVIDDVSFTGRTMSTLLGSLAHTATTYEKNVNFYTAALFQKPDSTYYTHVYGTLDNSDRWLVMPWEKD